MVKKLHFALLLVVLFVFTSCGGGNSNTPTEVVNNGNEETEEVENDTITTSLFGQLIDSPIQGVRYETSSGIKGVTNENISKSLLEVFKIFGKTDDGHHF